MRCLYFEFQIAIRTFPPLNIIAYNAFGGQSGDKLYGTEPISYYLKALVLNTSLAFPLSCLSVPALAVATFKGWAKNEHILERLTISCTLVLWLAVLFSRAHKEERFLYPAYPLLSFVSADFIVSVLFPAIRRYTESAQLSSVEEKCTNWKCKLSRVVLLLLSTVSFCLSFARVMSNYGNYMGIFSSWQSLEDEMISLSSSSPSSLSFNICVGNDWYTFPSHFFVTSTAKLQFVEDDFRGVLPQYFTNQNGTWAQPPQPFNNMNTEERSRYVMLESCDFLVLSTPSNGVISSSKLRNHTEKYMKEFISFPIIDKASSPMLTRAYFIPYISAKFNKFGTYKIFAKEQTWKISREKTVD